MTLNMKTHKQIVGRSTLSYNVDIEEGESDFFLEELVPDVFQDVTGTVCTV